MADNSRLAEALMMDSYKDNTLQDFLSRLQLSGSMGTSKQPGVNTTYGSGRAGIDMPIGTSNLNAGVGFGGYKSNVDVPGFKKTFKDFGVNNIDAAYSSGQNTLGGNYQINPEGKDGFNVYYRRNF
jgi:hypothetical protein